MSTATAIATPPARPTQPLPRPEPFDRVPAAADREAFAVLLESQRERMLRLARRMVRCPETAEDVVQDAMLAALSALPCFEGRAAATTWLHRIVVNAALMHLRRTRTRREVTLDDEPLPGGDATDAADLAERNDDLARLQACLEELSRDHRNVVDLRDIRGLDTAGTALVLGVSPNAVKIRLHRARRALRDRFGSTRPLMATSANRSDDVPIHALPKPGAATRAAG